MAYARYRVMGKRSQRVKEENIQRAMANVYANKSINLINEGGGEIVEIFDMGCVAAVAYDGLNDSSSLELYGLRKKFKKAISRIENKTKLTLVEITA